MIKRIAGYVMTALMVFSLCACGQYETVTGPQKQQYDIELSDIVLYDNNDITITAKGFNYSGEIGATLCIEIFNNSDIDIGVVAGLNFSVNEITGIPVITDNNGHTLSGQTKLFNMSIFDSELESANISEIHSMGVILNIDKYDGNTIMGILDTSDLIELNLSTSDTLFNENGVKITYVNYKEGVNFYKANFIIENNTQSDVTIIHYGYVNGELSNYLSEAFSKGYHLVGTDYLSETKTAVGLSMIDDDYGVKHNDVNYLEVTFEIFDKESSDCIGSVPKYRIEINDID